VSPIDLEVAPPVAPSELRSDERREYSFASRSVGSHLLRGIAGLGPLALAWYLWPVIGWVALAPAALGVVALRGCPMCWTIGLIQTVSRRRVQRVCNEDGCRLTATPGPRNESAGTLRT